MKGGDGYYFTDVLRIHRFLNPTFEPPLTFGDQRWAVFSQVEQIFKARGDILKNFAQLTTYVWTLIIPVSFDIALLFVSKHFQFSLPVLFALELCMFIPFVVVSYGLFRSNRLNLRLVRKDQKARAALRNSRIEKLIWLLVGIALGVIGEHFKP